MTASRTSFVSKAVSYTHLRAHETGRNLVCRLLLEKLGLDGNFVLHELGETTIRPHRDPRSKYKDEAYVTFETKEVRDAVKARASYLANFRDDQAGMRLHLPNYLQRDFRSLMGLAYELKKRHPELKRNVKFDEEDLGLFMDMQLDKGGHWRRVKPDEAKLAHTGTRTGPEKLGATELLLSLIHI